MSRQKWHFAGHFPNVMPISKEPSKSASCLHNCGRSKMDSAQRSWAAPRIPPLVCRLPRRKLLRQPCGREHGEGERERILRLSVRVVRSDQSRRLEQPCTVCLLCLITIRATRASPKARRPLSAARSSTRVCTVYLQQWLAYG